MAIFADGAAVLLEASQFRVGPRADVAGQGVHILVDQPAGAVLASFAQSRRVSEPTYLTVQLDANTHLELEPSFVQFVNHSCDPNVSFDMARLALVALRDLHAGDELTYFYPSTELTMAQPFDCACGSANCVGHISGASAMPRQVLERYDLSPFIRDWLAKHPD